MKHVVECAYLSSVNVTFADGARRRAYLDREDRELDLARLVFTSAELAPIGRPAIAAIAPGESACSATAFPGEG